jgi:hypothetical protein
MGVAVKLFQLAAHASDRVPLSHTRRYVLRAACKVPELEESVKIARLIN